MDNLFFGILLVLGILIGFCYFQNNSLQTTNIKLKAKLKNNLNIVHLSDLHSKEFGKSNSKLFNYVLSINPDIIFLTGDIIDSSLKNVDSIISFIGSLKSISTVVYIPGNNENRTNKIDYILSSLNDLGVITLNNEIITLNINNEVISILGLSENLYSPYRNKFDTAFHTYKYEGADSLLKSLESSLGYKILLSHYPENFSFKNTYSQYGFNLMLSGHAHGGQFILPFVGGLFAPGQGILPKFYNGLYKGDKNFLVVSRGLGNSGFPLRLFNRPNVVNIKLEKY